MKIIPITFDVAKKFINEHHRHHYSSQGCKFVLGLQDNNELIGVATCGRPVSRYLDDGFTIEITRLCTLGQYNACSKLYGACCRVAKQMGYTKIITYILESENGASLKASGFIYDGVAGGTHWTGCRFHEKEETLFELEDKTKSEMKKRYYKLL